jgi:hypothetical protein
MISAKISAAQIYLQKIGEFISNHQVPDEEYAINIL